MTGEVWELPSGRQPHIYAKPTYKLCAGSGPSNMTDVCVYSVLGGIFNVAGDPVMGICAYIELSDTGGEYAYRLDCKCACDGDVEDYLLTYRRASPGGFQETPCSRRGFSASFT